MSSEQMIGKVLGKYKIVEKLGSGGMADVYKGIQEGLEREVAIKVLPKAYSRDAEMVKRFKRESQATAKLAHPNIITIYDSGEQDGLCYYVMEYLKADSLDDIIKKEQKLPPKKALKIAQDILKALAYTHDKHILHRDLKPSNIKFDLRGNAIVTDFGLVKDLEQTSITVSGVSLGTPMYMSPEQLCGDAVDERSDLYQVGVITYEMLAGQPPFSGKGPYQPGSKAMSSELAAPSTLNPEVTPELDEFVLKALQKKAEDRCSSAKDMLEKLKQIERKSKVRQLSRQTPASGTKSLSVQTRSIPEQQSGVVGSGSISAQSISIAIARTLAGPSRTVALAIGIPSVLLFAAALVWVFMLIFPKPELKLLEKSFEVDADQAVISWRASAPCYSFLEYGDKKDEMMKSEVPAAPQTEYRQTLKSLKPDTNYYVRFLFSYDSDQDSFPAAWVRELQFHTRPQIEIINITVEEGATQATISWTTNLRTDTVVQYGKTEEYGTTQSNFEQKAETNHSIILTGLDPATNYHFKIIASDPEGKGGNKSSEDRTFTTKDSTDPTWKTDRGGGGGNSEDQLQDLAKSYVDKLTRMTPDERAKLKESINRFIDLDQGPLPEAKKAAVMVSKTTSQTFSDRFPVFAKWRKEMVKVHPEQEKALPERLERVLQKIFLDNPARACHMLDAALVKLRALDPAPVGSAPAAPAQPAAGTVSAQVPAATVSPSPPPQAATAAAPPATPGGGSGNAAPPVEGKRVKIDDKPPTDEGRSGGRR
ncbi:MAG: protein kinase [Candidatus Wallbacteria bacterium]|nr:protein kinase [Candidatus Wallbacteria bacterium]